MLGSETYCKFRQKKENRAEDILWGLLVHPLSHDPEQIPLVVQLLQYMLWLVCREASQELEAQAPYFLTGIELTLLDDVVKVLLFHQGIYYILVWAEFNEHSESLSPHILVSFREETHGIVDITF